MEALLDCLGPDPNFPGHTTFRNKVDGFIATEIIAGPEFWKKTGNVFQAKEDDIYIASYPRTGTTWTTEWVYLIASDLNFERAQSIKSRVRSPYLNFSQDPTEKESTNYDIPSPRCIRTHLPYSQLPKSILEKGCKIIYSVRNPKDTLVSYYHFSCMNELINYKGDFETFVELFLSDKLPVSPFWKHVLQYWEHRNEKNILFLGYEERKQDEISNIKKLATFLGKSLTDEQIESVKKFCSFDEMKKNSNLNFEELTVFKKSSEFIRKGEVGNWKNYFSPELNRRVDEYIDKYFHETGIDFIYEI